MAAKSFRVLVIIGLVISVAPFSAENASAHSWGSAAFERTWARTDLPVQQGQVDRTWMWGPSGYTEAFYEPYVDGPGGERLVQYTDKSRMEDNAYQEEAPWDVTNGLLALELISGRLQLGDDEFQPMEPANVQVAGDSHPESPTYATFNSVLGHDPLPEDSTIAQTIDQRGNIGSNASLGQHGVTAQHYVPETNHSVASVFWDFMNSSGLVYEHGQYNNDQIFENPFFATGFPITEAYWMNVPIAGEWRDVLAQCFERRCLTYTPGNPSGWQVEAGNIGQHYYQWRYGADAPAPPPPPPSDEEPDPGQYLHHMAQYLEMTHEDVAQFYRLMGDQTQTAGWYSEVEILIETWQINYSFIQSYEYPSVFEQFHLRIVDAYRHLDLAADDLHAAIYENDDDRYESARANVEEYERLVEDALNYASVD